MTHFKTGGTVKEMSKQKVLQRYHGEALRKDEEQWSNFFQRSTLHQGKNALWN